MLRRFQCCPSTTHLNTVFLFLSRSLSQSRSLCQDLDHDPPFSLLSSKPTKTTTTKPHQKHHTSKSKSKSKSESESKSEPTNRKDPRTPIDSNHLHFDFMYSYSETNTSVEPIGYREKKRFSPFGPGRIDRGWTGTAAPVMVEVDMESVEEKRRRVLGEPLTGEEVEEIVERYRHSDCARQINLGRDKSGGKIIYRHINILLLYRGRNYDPKTRPVVPPMLWKPYAPIYPKLVKNAPGGLTFEETKELRNRGLNSPPLTKLTRNGVYVNVMEKVREAFKTEEVV